MVRTETPRGYRREDSSFYPRGGNGECTYVELSAREMEVMRLLVTGITENAIGCTLGITRHTVRSHIAHSSRKLNVSGKLMLVAIVISYGIVPIEEVRELLSSHTGIPFSQYAHGESETPSRQTDDCN